MRDDFSHALQPVKISALRPTQMTVGLREVDRKRADWKARSERGRPTFLGQHMVPVVLGPNSVHYVIDHHHLVRALHEEGVNRVLVSVVADVHYLKKSVFWTFMDNRNWLHPFDTEGSRHPHDKLPKHIGAMKDDPYRSLAGELRRSGGYAKDATPYSEFLWADFLRHRVSLKLVKNDFERAIAKALDAAAQQDASYLPGWSGRADDASH